MLFTMRVPLDRLPAKTRAMLCEVKRIYGFADLADVLRWLLEPDLTGMVTDASDRWIKGARKRQAYQLLDDPDSVLNELL